MADNDRWRNEQDRFGNRGEDRSRWREEGNWRGQGRDERFGTQGGDQGGGFGQRGRESGFGDYRRDFDEGDRGYQSGYQGYGYESGYAGNRGGRFGYGDMDRDYQGGFNRGSGMGPGRGYGSRGGQDEDRSFWEKASDRVSSWLGHDDAERRRRMDQMQGGGHRGRGPKGYTRSDDRIREDVSDRLTDDPGIDASDIEVMVANGEVTLSGTVSTRGEKRRAEDLAEDISGVKHVQNNLRVAVQSGLQSGQGATDVEVTSTGSTARRSA